MNYTRFTHVLVLEYMYIYMLHQHFVLFLYFVLCMYIYRAIVKMQQFFKDKVLTMHTFLPVNFFFDISYIRIYMVVGHGGKRKKNRSSRDSNLNVR